MDELKRTFGPMMKFSSIFGFLPFYMQENGKVKVSKIKIMYTFILLTILDYFVYLRIMHLDEYRQKGSFLSKISILFGILATEVFIIITVILNITYHETFGYYMQVIYQFDLKVINFFFSFKFFKFLNF